MLRDDVLVQLFTRLDVQTGEEQSWCPGDRCFCEELIFVPGPKGDTEEDDGVLLGMIFDGERMQSSLAVSHPPSKSQIACRESPSCDMSECLQ